MTTDCNVKTVTEIEGEDILIRCFALDNQEEGGVDRPTVFQADLLETPKTMNKTSGKEGELLLTHMDSNETIGEINNRGELTLTLNDDDAEEYNVNERGELTYG